MKTFCCPVSLLETGYTSASVKRSQMLFRRVLTNISHPDTKMLDSWPEALVGEPGAEVLELRFLELSCLHVTWHELSQLFLLGQVASWLPSRYNVKQGKKMVVSFLMGMIFLFEKFLMPASSVRKRRIKIPTSHRGRNLGILWQMDCWRS